MLVTDEEHLGAFHQPRQKMISRPQLTGELSRQVDGWVDLPMQPPLGLRERPRHLAEGDVTDHHHIHIAFAPLLAACDGPKDKRRTDSPRQRPQRRREHTGHAHGLQNQPPKLLERRALRTGPVKDLPPDFPAVQQANFRQQLQFPLDRPQPASRQPHHVPHMKLLVRPPQQQRQHRPPSLPEQHAA